MNRLEIPSKPIVAIASLALVAGGLLAGCSTSPGEPEGYKAADFSRRPPPPGYGPAGGAAASGGSKPAATPPSGN